jgi:hypothetical protein
MNATRDNQNSLTRNDTRQKCFVCETEIVDGRSFCKVNRESEKVVLCSPRCALRYFDSLNPPTNGDEQSRAASEQSLHFLVDEEKP